jgi:hypothetical protein
VRHLHSASDEVPKRIKGTLLQFLILIGHTRSPF